MTCSGLIPVGAHGVCLVFNRADLVRPYIPSSKENE